MAKKENVKKDDIVIEDAFKRLEEINNLLASPETSLKDSLALYAEGVKLVSACKDSLIDVEKEIQILNESDNNGDAE
ncbi:MAG: exodeoxyribonuclease VII small subunit [Lachnospiraceae bacterium]|nr:exodeoxyribonuclease VII small subunit [Lachnospiraceae bacterium]